MTAPDQGFPATSGLPATSIVAQPAMPTGSVLLVEDDPTYQVVLQAALSRAGYTIQVAVDGPEMMAQFATLAARLPQLVTLDWLLPGPADGLTALHWIRAHRDPRIQVLPVLVLTAARHPTQVRRVALDAGASECLPKITPLEQIAHTITALIRASAVVANPTSAAPAGCPLSLAGHQTIRADQGLRITLTPSQADLLHLLMEQPGAAVPYATLESRLFPLYTERRGLLRRRVYRLNQRLGRLGVRVRAVRREAAYRLSWS